jgi:hypothetical protein
MVAEKPKMLPELMRALNFNEDDLAAYRANRITHRQQQIFWKMNRDLAKIILFFTGFALVIGPIINIVLYLFKVGGATYQDIFIPRLVVTMLTPIAFLWGIIGKIFWENWRDARGNASVRQVTGYVNRKKHLVNLGTNFRHHLLIKDLTFEVGEHVYYAFDEGFLYTIYYTPRTKHILAAEIIPEVP